MCFKLIYLILILILCCNKLIFCQDTNILNEVISNPIILPNRENRVLFALSKICTEKRYQKLLETFFSLEKQTQTNFTGINYGINVNFGDAYKVNFTKSDKLDETYGNSWCSKDKNCFEASKVSDVNSLASNFVNIDQPCPEIVKKEFILIISDVCITSLTKQFDDATRCFMNYRSIWLLLPTENDAQQCKKRISQNIQIFSNESISNEIHNYSDMNVEYQATMASSTMNLLVMVKEPFYHAYDYFDLTLDNVPLCTQGPMFGFFQYLATNAPTQRISKMFVPMNYENPSFISDNYHILIKNFTPGPEECSFIKNFLSQANSMPNDKEQWNILLIQDPYPSCLKNFGLKWNNSNRHLEIIVTYSKMIENDYSKFILHTNESLNHITFYKESDGLLEFWKDTTICRKNIASRNITEKAKPIKEPENSTPILMEKINNEGIKLIWWIIGSIVLVLCFIGFVIGGRYIYVKRTTNKRISFIREKADSITSWTQISHSEKYWKMLLNDEDLIIDNENVLGKGATANVYKAVLKTTNAFRSLSTVKVAAKVSTSFETNDFEEFMNELNSLTLLMDHPNIIELKGWTLTGNVPVIVTELAENNLLDFVKSLAPPPSKVSKDDVKIILQILWQISGALNYIAKNKMIHRDVACRNVLLTDKNIAKLADFGLCCQMKENIIYQDTEHKKFPLKWLSIEALTECKFSEKSDVWAFGVLCYEAFTFGAIPYSNLSSSEMIEFLQNGKRLEKPENASDCIYEIMLNCWEKEPNARATFKEIHDKIEQVLEYGYLPLKNDTERLSFY